jgi:hypothetical protein
MKHWIPLPAPRGKIVVRPSFVYIENIILKFLVVGKNP